MLGQLQKAIFYTEQMMFSHKGFIPVTIRNDDPS